MHALEHRLVVAQHLAELLVRAARAVADAAEQAGERAQVGRVRLVR